jgi:hypothetical protein
MLEARLYHKNKALIDKYFGGIKVNNNYNNLLK